jgi:hypothetical protein
MAGDGKEWVCPYGVRWTIVQELGTGIESPVIMIELDRERRRAILMLFEYRLSLPC